MKTAAWMISALVACIAARVNADGVCFDPNHNSGFSADSARRDMETIKGKGFSHVRTYITDFGVDLADIVVKSGLRAALGIPYPVDGGYRKHIENAVKAAQSGKVDFIFVGNEHAKDGLMATASIIREIKSRVPGNVRVGTVQRSIDYIQPASGMADVVAASDVVGVNIHPFFHPNTKAENAIKETDAQWQACLSANLPGIRGKLMLTETGWPSSGSGNNNQGTPEGAERYFQDYKKWSSFLPDDKKYYFQMFDTPYKGGFEANYGIVKFDSSPKFNAGGNPAPAPAPTTPAPTTPAPTTPAPTTPAPTTPAPTTVSPTDQKSNSTSSLSGSVAGEVDLVTGSGSVDADAGSEVESVGSAETETTESTAENEAGVADLSGDAATDGEATADATSGTRTVGDNKKSDTVEANVKSATTAGANLGVIVVAAFGVAAVGAAFAFIYKARQKAAELESSERKSFDSFAITPGGGCAL